MKSSVQKYIKRKSRMSNRTPTTRDEINKEVPVALQIIKSLLYSYIITGILLVIIAFFLYRFQLKENVIVISIILTYIISTFVGGVSIGKYMKERKYLWGIVIGVLYVALLLIITLGVYRTLDNENIATTLVLCICSGCIGGMLA